MGDIIVLFGMYRWLMVWDRGVYIQHFIRKF